MVHLTVNISSNADDKVVEDIARAWPSLRTLRLVRDPHNMGQPALLAPTGVKPNGLANLVRACPHLRDLALQLDMRGLELCMQRPWPDLDNKQIRVLEVGSSLIDSATPASHIAAFLTDLFPNLATITEDGEPPTGKWLEVSQLLEAFRVTRAQERQRAMSRNVAHGANHSVETQK
ncbi:hypothetical protein C8Q72DRAFT_777077 [Fomitopsis betulina]|nr:hypothetical protein C8Q72DRAFT_777077 [Fomitopsis betulina]